MVVSVGNPNFSRREPVNCRCTGMMQQESPENGKKASIGTRVGPRLRWTPEVDLKYDGGTFPSFVVNPSRG